MHAPIGPSHHSLTSSSSHPQPPKPFLKNRQFYKPESFIWNNPHRASPQMYKFYHSYNDHFQAHKQPLIRRLEQQDREEAEAERIHRLMAFRSSTRRLFAEQQRNREALEERSMNGSTTAIRTETGLPLHIKYRSQKALQAECWGQKSATCSNFASQRTIQADKGHRTSLGRHDASSPNIGKLINDARQEWQLRIKAGSAATHPQHLTSSPKVHPLKRVPF